MWSMAKRLTAHRAKVSAWIIGLVFGVVVIGGCGTLQFQAGKKFNPALLEQSLRTGVSTQGDVKSALGEPYGQGRTMMPYHESDRTVWTYFYERGDVDIATLKTHDQRVYLFIFFADDRFDGYMWFASELQ